MPFIDSIDADSFHLQKGGLEILGFNWAMGQSFNFYRDTSGIDPIPSPIMAGGLFTMERKYFWELGGYDPGSLVIFFILISLKFINISHAHLFFFSS